MAFGDGISIPAFNPPDYTDVIWSEDSGTSFATPVVAGGCALLRQYFINQGLPPPSPAMTKAWLINSASRTSDHASFWSDRTGWGMMNLGNAFDGTPRLIRDELAADLFTASGQTRTFTIPQVDSTRPFRATLAWTDAPGSTTGAAYNNDLDLTVTVGGQTYLGNVFNGGWSVTGGSPDSTNNVECVFLPPGQTGPFTVKVTAANLNSAGVPRILKHWLTQDFALVVNYGTWRPQLSLQPAGSGAVLGWPVTSTNYVLETTARLSPADWQPVPAAPVTVGTQHTVTIALTNASQFFRLRQP
jgi:hypothetical protein